MPTRASDGPKSFDHPTWSALADTVEVGNVKKIRVDSNESRISVDGQDQPQIYEI